MPRGAQSASRTALVVLAGLLLAACSATDAGTSSSSTPLSAKDQSVCTAMEAKIAQMDDALGAFTSPKAKASANQLRAVNVAIVNLGAAAQKQAKLASPALSAQLATVASKVGPLELALSGQGGSVSATSNSFLKAAKAVSASCTAQG
jgi:hypothetical protein